MVDRREYSSVAVQGSLLFQEQPAQGIQEARRAVDALLRSAESRRETYSLLLVCLSKINPSLSLVSSGLVSFSDAMEAVRWARSGRWKKEAEAGRGVIVLLDALPPDFVAESIETESIRSLLSESIFKGKQQSANRFWLLVGRGKDLRAYLRKSFGLVPDSKTEEFEGWKWLSGRPRKTRETGIVDEATRSKYEAIALEEIEKDGFVLIERREALARLGKTNFAQRDLNLLRLNFGACFEAGCGCRWHISSKGDLTRLYSCSLDCAEELPVGREKPQEIVLLGDNIPTKRRCGECGSVCVMDNRLVRATRAGFEISSDLKCTGDHGLVVFLTQIAPSVKVYQK